MARAATTADVFNAIAEPRRRQIIDLLADTRQWPVGEVCEVLRLPQPTVSKHLGVLRKVGLVSVARLGQQRLYSLNPQELKPVHEWTQHFERFWDDQLVSIKEAAERKAKQRSAANLSASKHQPHSKEQGHGH